MILIDRYLALSIVRGLSTCAYICTFTVAWKFRKLGEFIHIGTSSVRKLTLGWQDMEAEGTHTRDHGNMFDGRTVSSPYWFRRTQARTALYSIYSVYIIHRFASNQAPFGFLSSM